MKSKKRKVERTRKGTQKITAKLSSYSSSISSGKIMESDMSLSIHFEEKQNILTFSDDYIENLRKFAY